MNYSSNILTNPEWLTAIGTLSAVIVALFIGFLDKFLYWVNRPKIVFDAMDVVETYGSNSIRYYRFKIINKGGRVAKNCQVRLLSVEPVGRVAKFPLIEQDKLKWTSAPTDSRYSIPREKLDISPNGGWEFCDLFRLDSFILTDIFFQSLGGNRKVSIREDYVITIEISGENIEPKKAKIRTFLPQNGFWYIDVKWIKNISQ